MKKIDIKNKETYTKDDMKRYLGSLAETHNSSLKAVKEGFQIINRKLDNQEKILNTHTEILNKHEKILNTHTEILNKHEKILNTHTEILNKNEKILNSHTEMIGSIMEDVSVLKEDSAILKNDMQIVKKELKKKVDYDEFLSLVQRVNKLESKN